MECMGQIDIHTGHNNHHMDYMDHILVHRYCKGRRDYTDRIGYRGQVHRDYRGRIDCMGRRYCRDHMDCL